jgi:hypothetical protein
MAKAKVEAEWLGKDAVRRFFLKLTSGNSEFILLDDKWITDLVRV